MVLDDAHADFHNDVSKFLKAETEMRNYEGKEMRGGIRADSNCSPSMIRYTKVDVEIERQV